MKEELIVYENMTRQLDEMWDAIIRIPTNDPDRDFAIAQAQEIENEMKARFDRQEKIRDASFDMIDAFAGHEVPQLFRISWLQTLLRECNKPSVYKALLEANYNDADSVNTMLREVEELKDLGTKFVTDLIINTHGQKQNEINK